MATRAPLTQAEKEHLKCRREAGAPVRQIADELHCSVETIRKWWRYLRTGQSPSARGRPRTGILSTYPSDLVEQALAVKRAHPHWGPANVQLELQRRRPLPRAALPSEARLAALFRARCPEAVQAHRRQPYPAQPPPAVRFPHQRWQIDGKEKVTVAEQEVTTVLTIRDPAGALMIASRAILTTTERGWRKVTLAEVQETLRSAFEVWGCPLAVQTDHEVVYTGAPAADFPSLFTLWLIGLGIDNIPSRDRRPTDQPPVERSHRTLGDMAWKDEHFDRVEQLQAALDDHRQRYNEELPVHAADCQGRPPLVAHPLARHSGRPFHRTLEWTLFDLTRVDAYLASQVWTRQISATGNVSVGHHVYYVGRTHLNESVSVRFIPETRAFRFQLTDGSVLRELPALGLDQADLIGYMPIEVALPVAFQFPLPLVGV